MLKQAKLLSLVANRAKPAELRANLLKGLLETSGHAGESPAQFRWRLPGGREAIFITCYPPGSAAVRLA